MARVTRGLLMGDPVKLPDHVEEEVRSLLSGEDSPRHPPDELTRIEREIARNAYALGQFDAGRRVLEEQ